LIHKNFATAPATSQTRPGVSPVLAHRAGPNRDEIAVPKAASGRTQPPPGTLYFLVDKTAHRHIIFLKFSFLAEEEHLMDVKT
jgi:hypothetical protein